MQYVQEETSERRRRAYNGFSAIKNAVKEWSSVITSHLAQYIKSITEVRCSGSFRPWDGNEIKMLVSQVVDLYLVDIFSGAKMLTKGTPFCATCKRLGNWKSLSRDLLASLGAARSLSAAPVQRQQQQTSQLNGWKLIGLLLISCWCQNSAHRFWTLKFFNTVFF